MQPTIRPAGQSAAHGSAVGYLCMLVLLIFAVALLALGTPRSASSPGSVFFVAPISAPASPNS
jgi:hypothetical protein